MVKVKLWCVGWSLLSHFQFVKLGGECPAVVEEKSTLCVWELALAVLACLCRGASIAGMCCVKGGVRGGCPFGWETLPVALAAVFWLGFIST